MKLTTKLWVKRYREHREFRQINFMIEKEICKERKTTEKQYKILLLGRRKWIHCFEDVPSIIFFAALSEFNRNLIEDPSVNRLKESIALFKTVLKNSFLKDCSKILFLNKEDIFDKKIRWIDLKEKFADYNGNCCDPDDGKKFILNKFVGSGKRKSRIYHHITVATNPDNIKFVFSAVKNTILTNIIDNIFSNGLKWKCQRTSLEFQVFHWDPIRIFVLLINFKNMLIKSV